MIPSQRWARSPLDFHAHLLAPEGEHPHGVLKASCGVVLPMGVTQHDQMPPGLRCERYQLIFRADSDAEAGQHPAWCCPQHCYVTDDRVRVHQSAPTRHEDGGARFETQLVSPEDESETYLELIVEDLTFGRDVPPFLPLATVARLRDQLTAHLDTAGPPRSSPTDGPR